LEHKVGLESIFDILEIEKYLEKLISEVILHGCSVHMMREVVTDEELVIVLMLLLMNLLRPL